MALSKKPMTGMKDILPDEMEIRDYVIGIIKETYGNYGFTSIETPCVENLANLNCKAGGENEKLIFKILKRGEKLRIDEAKSEEDLADGGLRYDLTVPLVRYYSNHANELPAPFKALQMGNVWRAILELAAGSPTLQQLQGGMHIRTDIVLAHTVEIAPYLIQQIEALRFQTQSRIAE